jgi:hypothetical protein
MGNLFEPPLSVNTEFRLVEGVPACPLGNHPDDVSAWQETHGQQVMQFGVDDLPLFDHAATQKRVIGYVRAALEKGATIPLQTLIRRFLDNYGMPRSERMIRYYMAAIRESRLVYVFRARVGRSFMVFVRSRTRAKASPTLPQPAKKQAEISPCNDYYKGSLKGLKRNAGLSPGASRLRGFAWAVARNLQACHWDSCKVRFDLRHAFNFTLQWLQSGRLFNDIRDAYDAALHQRHKDATDWDLNNGRNLVRWAPSSTVTLASQLLRGQADPMTWSKLQEQARSGCEWGVWGEVGGVKGLAELAQPASA